MQQTPSSALLKQRPASGQGLTSTEAKRRRAAIGPNEPTPIQRAALLRQLLTFLVNPLVVILLLASVVAGVLG